MSDKSLIDYTKKIKKKKINCPTINLFDLEIIILPKNTEIFRNGIMHKNRPEWFGSFTIADKYKNYYTPHTRKFKTIKELKLLDFNKKNLLNFYKSVEKSLDENDKKIFNKVCFFDLELKEIEKIKEFNKMNPTYSDVFHFVGFFSQNDQDYYSLLFAKLLCSFGFDGWYLEPQKIIQRSKILTSSMKMGRSEEFLICLPDKVIKNFISDENAMCLLS